MKQIRDIVDGGDADQAHTALDQLLALGPQNTEALKLRARLFELEGRFVEEAKVWDRVAAIDREDPDAVAFLLRRQLEDREHFYFTDDVPGGGRRFLAYPRRLMHRCGLTLLGSLAFVLVTRLSSRIPAVADPNVMMALFGLLVIFPWTSIATVYLSGLKAVTLSPHGIAIATRLRVLTMPWAELERVYLARGRSRAEPFLSLVLLPKNRTVRTVEIDLNPDSTAIRARTYLVREIGRLFSEPEYVPRETLNLDRRRLTSY